MCCAEAASAWAPADPWQRTKRVGVGGGKTEAKRECERQREKSGWCDGSRGCPLATSMGPPLGIGAGQTQETWSMATHSWPFPRLVALPQLPSSGNTEVWSRHGFEGRQIVAHIPALPKPSWEARGALHDFLSLSFKIHKMLQVTPSPGRGLNVQQYVMQHCESTILQLKIVAIKHHVQWMHSLSQVPGIIEKWWGWPQSPLSSSLEPGAALPGPSYLLACSPGLPSDHSFTAHCTLVTNQLLCQSTETEQRLLKTPACRALAFYFETQPIVMYEKHQFNEIPL